MLAIAGWFLLGIVLAVRYGWTRRWRIVPRVLHTLALVLIGPVYFPVWLLIDVVWRKRKKSLTWKEAWRTRLNQSADASAPAQDPDFVLMGTDGQPFSRGSSKNAARSAGLRRTNQVLKQAVTELASDVLIQPTGDESYSVRYRVNGSMRGVVDIDVTEGKAVINIIKAVSGMNLAERRRPQDGMFSAETPTGLVSFRVATAGVVNGEKVSVRILDQSSSEKSLKDVGLLADDEQTVRRATQIGSGMVLVCGPTGSGKSTTVHAMLRSIDRVKRNVITIEDPIEYILTDASQIEVNQRAGITFASVLRNVLRQDPDVIFVGEIRDAETAEIAVQAAQTGHLVFATVHSGSNEAALLRLMDLGLKPQLMAAAVKMLISQRLVRRLCEHCKSRATFTEAQKQGLSNQSVPADMLFAAVGCERCHQSGFTGRVGVFDIQAMDENLRRRLNQGDFSARDRTHAVNRQSGKAMTMMQVRATQLALAGQTTWEDVMRLSSTIE